MNKSMRINILFLLFIFIFSCRSSKNINLIEESNNLLIETFINNSIKNKVIRPFNGAIIISKEGTEIYKKFYGFSDFETQHKIDSTTQFAIGSLAKQFTAVLILLEVQKEKLDLNESITKYLDTLSKEKYEKITVRQLLNHTSGINTLNSKLEFPAGTDFSYSNTGYNLLGKILEKVSGKSYGELAHDLFDKCAMENTTTADKYIKGNLAIGYDGIPGKSLKPIEHLLNHLNSKNIGIPAGGIISTPRDLVIWNQKLHSGKILEEEFYSQMITPSALRKHAIFGTIDYGYGIQISKEIPKEYFHAGYIKGFPSLNLYFPDDKLSVIVLENVSNDSADFPFIYSHQVNIRNLIRSILEVKNKT